MVKREQEQDSNSQKDRMSDQMSEENGIKIDKREITDRRTKPTPFLSRYTFFGHRKSSRRDTDPTKNYYIDRVGGKYLLAILVIIILSVSDSIFTLRLIKMGYREINPLLNAFLFSNKLFLIIKYLLTVVGITALALHKYFVFVKQLIIFLITGYLILNIYQIWLVIRL